MQRLASRPAGLAALAAVVLLAAGLRLWRLDAIPPGLFGDEAADGLVARQILAGERWPLYVEEPEATKWGSREPLYHYLVAAVFAAGGATPTTLRLTSALLGIATVPLLFALCRRLFDDRLALLAAALLAVNRWHLTISRLGVRAVLAPLWMVLAALALTVLVQRRRRRDAIAFGAVLGLGLYTYPAVWAVPAALAVPAGIGWWRARRPPGASPDEPGRQRAPRLGGSRALPAYALAAALAVAAPLLVYAAAKPDYFFARAARTAGAQVAPVRDTAQRVLFMLHFRGDANPRHNLPGAPMLDPVAGALFAVGVLVTLRRLGADPVRGAGLLAAWLVPLLPSAFSDAAPHALRAAGALPAVSTLAAIGLARLAPAGRLGAVGALAAVTLIGAWTARDYFQRWGADARVATAFNGQAVGFFRFSAGLAADHDVYSLPAVFDAPQWRFLDLQPRRGWYPLDARALAGAGGRDRVLISDRADLNALIEAIYPDAEVLSRFTADGRRGRVYRIRAARLRRVLTPDEHARFEALLPVTVPRPAE